MSYDEILDKFCISQCLPGIIVANTALFVGYKLRGVAGAIAAIVGVTISAFVIIISVANILSVIFHNKVVNNIFDYVNLSVIVLILVTLKDMFPKCIVDKTTLFFISCVPIFNTWLENFTIFSNLCRYNSRFYYIFNKKT
ncbi:MAG: chromate transporter [Candidatus Melainabacteria bacterium]|nr:MAG: chromate transporter [Candidatus Melainabacteria bacterium]